MAFSLVPVIVTTWFFGLPIGMLAIIFVITLESYIIFTTEAKDIWAIMHDGGWAGFITTSVVAAIVSHFRGLHKQLSRELSERKRAEAALAKESSLNAALADLSRALISESNLYDMPGLVVDHATRLTGSEMGYVGFIDPQTGCLVSSHQSLHVWEKCRMTDKTIMFKEFTGLWGWVLKNKKPIIANHPEQDERSSGLPNGHIPIHRFLSVPAIIDGNLVGQIAVANAPVDYNQDDLSVMEKLANLYGAVVYQQQLKEKYHFLSLHDPLTGLYNRRHLEEVTNQIKQSGPYPVSIIIVDLDRLKEVNDHQGHSFGDIVIRTAGELLQSTFRCEDVIARIGGDEFAILLPHATETDAANAILRIRHVIDQHNQSNASPRMMMSLGAVTANNRMELEVAVKNADSAMYLDKLSRRHTIARP